MTIHSWNKFLSTKCNVYIIHHWDIDGISSAVLVTQYLNTIGDFNISYILPEIGTYRLQTDKSNGNIVLPDKKPDICFILDYSVPEKDIISLQKELNAPVVIYDHHIRNSVRGENIFFYNPVANGDSSSKWPSCTWVLKKLLELELNDLIVIGVAGDMEERFLPEGFNGFSEIKQYLNCSTDRYRVYVAAKNLIDIHYKENDKELLREMPEYLLKVNGSPDAIMEEKGWAEKHKLHYVEIENYIKQPPFENIGNKLQVYMIDTDKNIVSALTRRFAAAVECNYVMVINKGFFNNKSQIYVRRADWDKESSVVVFDEAALSLSAEVGRKEDVVGIIIDNSKVNDYIDMVKKGING